MLSGSQQSEGAGSTRRHCLGRALLVDGVWWKRESWPLVMLIEGVRYGSTGMSTTYSMYNTDQHDVESNNFSALLKCPNTKYRDIIQVLTILASRRYQCVYMALRLYTENPS